MTTAPENQVWPVLSHARSRFALLPVDLGISVVASCRRGLVSAYPLGVKRGGYRNLTHTDREMEQPMHAKLRHPRRPRRSQRRTCCHGRLYIGGHRRTSGSGILYIDAQRRPPQIAKRPTLPT